MFRLFIVCLSCLVALSPWAQTKKPPVKKTPAQKTTPTQKKGAVKKPAAKTPVKKPVAKKPVKKVVTPSTERLVEITTDMGVIVAKLYDSTPLHRDNFIKLVETGFYDSLLFHRIIEGFMIQGGDPNSKHAQAGQPLGMGKAPGDRIPAEFNPACFHKKGALAAARDNNPEKASSNCQFYIVQGKPYTAAELDEVFVGRVQPSNPTFQYTELQKETYRTIGGTPFLDQSYTVFGEVITGLEIIDQIARSPKGPGDRPIQDIRMKMRLLN
ncbi:peptidylprolyl isomerase [Segetibacter sp. 3557_3]|uniref:peptidylprolyl isomerase n=1 Tax=Segetibacter sp. 3557_3 TaxID=2547429 RepID=UPI00105919F9|nr:peptidylprolyl isomerase [Segetibacter sp. 3557_3]TDH23051.1 peptidylprolyl isomerase [Segetibacter sp. 3557_3]